MNEELIIIGLVIKAQGNKGEVLVEPLTDDPKRFETLKEIFLFKDKLAPKLYSIETIWRHTHNHLVLKLGGCDSISEAQTLVKANLGIREEDLVSLPDGSYFHFQIIGLEAYTQEGQCLGKVTEIFPTGSNDVYVISDGQKEYLVPAIADVICQVDLTNKRLIVKLLDGLT